MPSILMTEIAQYSEVRCNISGGLLAVLLRSICSFSKSILFRNQQENNNLLKIKSQLPGISTLEVRFYRIAKLAFN